MLIYIITFILSYLFMIGAWKCQRNKALFYILSLLAILIPSLLAGFRDETVGHDLVHYATPCWDACAKMDHISEAFLYIAFSGLEELYVIYDFLLTRFTADFFWMLFIQMLFILSIIYMFCYKMRRELNAPLYFLSYLFFYFCPMMSANRQAFAVAIVVFSYLFVMKREKWKFLLCIIFAYGFHHSALLAFLIYPLDVYLSRIDEKKFVRTLGIISITGIVLYLVFSQFVAYLISIGLFASKYERYLDADYNVHKIDLLVFFLFFFYTKFIGQYKKLANKTRLLILISFFITLLGVYNDIATRVALYINLYWMVCFLRLVNTTLPARKNIMYFIYISIFISMFLYLAIEEGYAETIPYTSKELGIK